MMPFTGELALPGRHEMLDTSTLSDDDLADLQQSGVITNLHKLTGGMLPAAMLCCLQGSVAQVQVCKC